MLLELANFVLAPFYKNFLENLNEDNAALEVLKLYGSNKFTIIRFWDAPFIEVEKLIPRKGSILDLGCGEGIFSNYLGISSPDRNILGVDIDMLRIKQADRGVKNVAFAYGNVSKLKFPEVDCVVMFHLLHHMSSHQDQENLISRCFKVLTTTGTLIIVEVEPKYSIKYFLSWSTDHFLVPWIFENKFYSKIFFRKSGDWKRLIEKLGFSCNIKKIDKGKPFSHVLLICNKK